MADRKISDLTALTAPAAGDYLPIVDISEASAANKNKRITIEELLRGAPDGTAAAPSIGFESDPNTGIYRPGADQLAISTGGTGRLFVDANGRVGVGTGSPTTTLDCRGVISTNDALYCYNSARDGLGIWYNPGGAGVNQLTARVNGGDRLTIDGSGNVGVGTTSFDAGDILHVSSTGDVRLRVSTSSTSAGSNAAIRLDATTNGKYTIQTGVDVSGGLRVFDNIASAERARIDSSGRLLVGTSTSLVSSSLLQVAGNNYPAMSINSFGSASNPEYLFRSARGTQSSPTASSDGDKLGAIYFQGYDGAEYLGGAKIEAFVDGAVTGGGTDDLPGRLVFATTADGASSPTERMRISNAGGSAHFATQSGAGSAVLEINASSGAGTTDYLLWATHSATTVFTGTVALRAYTNGNVQNINNSYGAISDVKFKENIVNAGSQWSDIKSLQVRKYNFKEETGQQTHTQIGLIAQEVELVSPGLVNESPDRDEDGNDLGTVTKSVNYSVLYMKAVKALQEAMERIETLEAKVAALEGA